MQRAINHRPQPGIWQKQKSNFEKLKNNWRPSGHRPEISSRSDARDGPRSPRRCHRAATVAAVPPLGGMRAVPSHDHHRCAPLPHTACPAVAVMLLAGLPERSVMLLVSVRVRMLSAREGFGPFRSRKPARACLCAASTVPGLPCCSPGCLCAMFCWLRLCVCTCSASVLWPVCSLSRVYLFL